MKRRCSYFAWVERKLQRKEATRGFFRLVICGSTAGTLWYAVGVVMKKALALVLVLVISVSMLAGCAKTEKNQETAKSGQEGKDDAAKDNEVKTTESGYQLKNITDEPVTLRFMWWGGDERNNATLEVIDQFMELYPNVTIEPEYGGNEGYKEKLVTQLYSETAADLIQCDPAWFFELVENGDYFVDYKEYQDYFDFTVFDETLLKNYGEFDGKLFAVPTGSAGSALVLNKALADKIGLDYTSQLTWDSLIEMGRKVQEYNSNTYMLNLDTLTIAGQIIRPMIMQKTGYPFINDEAKARSFTKEQLVEVLEYVKLLYDSGTLQPAQESAPFYNATDTNTKWIAGEFVSALGFASTANNLINAYGAEDKDFIAIQSPLPEGRLNDGYLTAPPQVMATAKTCKYPEVAAAFWDYFFNSEEAVLTLKDLRSVPAIEKNRAILNENKLINPVVKDALDFASALNGTSEHGYTTGSEISQIIIDMVENIAYGNSTTEKVADDAIALIDDFLAQQ